MLSRSGKYGKLLIAKKPIKRLKIAVGVIHTLLLVEGWEYAILTL